MARRAAVAVGAIFLTTTYMGSCAAARDPTQVSPSARRTAYLTIINILECAPGAREVRHTHPGPLSGYVLEGTLTLEHEGRPGLLKHLPCA
jgi:quercetin dioxygenase-like cupin family protein